MSHHQHAKPFEKKSLSKKKPFMIKMMLKVQTAFDISSESTGCCKIDLDNYYLQLAIMV